MSEIIFLSVEQVVEIHDQQIALLGGLAGILSLSALESALAQPQAHLFGKYLYEDLAAMASAYLFHLTNAHAFNDANKRTAVLSVLTFLPLNGVELEYTEEELYTLALDVANHRLDKPAIADWIRNRLSPNVD